MEWQYTLSILRTVKRIDLKNIKRGKYFRLIADVYVYTQSLGEALLAANSHEGTTAVSVDRGVIQCLINLAKNLKSIDDYIYMRIFKLRPYKL